MRVVADANIPYLDHYLGQQAQVVRYPGRQLTTDQLAEADILLVRSVTQVDAQLLQGTRVRWVGTTTIGTDHIDQAWLQQQGIGFAHAPGCNAQAVAEYVLAALLAVAGDEPWPEWRVGIIGAGHTGSAVLRLLSALGLECVIYDPPLQQRLQTGDLEQHPEPSQVASYPFIDRLEDLLGSVDMLTCHVPLVTQGRDATHHLLGREQLARLADNTLLINACRGAVVDNQALVAGEAQRLRCVLDVWEQEPWITEPLLSQVQLATPHIAGYSLDGKVRGVAQVYEALAQFLGWPAVTAWPELPCPESPQLTITAESWPSAVSQAVAQAYAVTADHQRLCQALAAYANEDRVGRSGCFDQLRRDYPLRREWQALNLARQQQRRWPQLAALGFSAPE